MKVDDYRTARLSAKEFEEKKFQAFHSLLPLTSDMQHKRRELELSWAVVWRFRAAHTIVNPSYRVANWAGKLENEIL